MKVEMRKDSKRLGGGKFGEVYVGRYNGEEVAVKTTNCPTGF